MARQKPLSSKGWSGQGVCRTLLAVDDLVAAVRDELQAQGRLSNTIFVLSGDNGMNAGEHRLKGKQAPYVTDIPFYMAWPDGWGNVPRTIGERVQNIKLAPTICAIAGCTLGPYPNGQARPDGKSFAGLLDGTEPNMGRDALLEDLPYAVGVGVPAWYSVETTPLSPLGRWLYVEYATGERELFRRQQRPLLDLGTRRCRRSLHARQPCRRSLPRQRARLARGPPRRAQSRTRLVLASKPLGRL